MYLLVTRVGRARERKIVSMMMAVDGEEQSML